MISTDSAYDNVYTDWVDWTPEMAVETDARVRVELRTSRASLVRFVAEGAWRLLPQGYTTAAAYVQDAAGVKRSEAYRLVATARASEIILTRFIQQDEEELDIKPWQWLVNDVIRSSHTGEHLASVIHELIVDIETALSSGSTENIYDAIRDGVTSHQRPAGDQGSDLSNPSTGGSDNEEPAASGSASDDSSGDPGSVLDVESLARGERVIICPNCQTPLR